MAKKAVAHEPKNKAETEIEKVNQYMQTCIDFNKMPMPLYGKSTKLEIV